MFNPVIPNSFKLKKIELNRRINMKQCNKCVQNKKNKEFHANAAKADGLADWCKECIKDYRKSKKNNKVETLKAKKATILKASVKRNEVENGETVVLDPVFMTISKDWGEENFEAVGHRLILVNITGVIFSKRSSHSYSVDLADRTIFPIVVTIKDHGETKLLKIPGNRYNIIRDGLLTWQPASPKGAGNLKFKFNVKSIITQNISTGYYIGWRLTQNGDGELYAAEFRANKEASWVKMKDMTRKDIINIADELVYDICQYFPGRSMPPQWVCKKILRVDSKIKKLTDPESPAAMREVN